MWEIYKSRLKVFTVSTSSPTNSLPVHETLLRQNKSTWGIGVISEFEFRFLPGGKKRETKMEVQFCFFTAKKNENEIWVSFSYTIAGAITWSVQLPHWAYVTAFSQNDLFLDYLFAENRLLELTWVIRSMKREEKNGGPMRGRLHI